MPASPPNTFTPNALTPKWCWSGYQSKSSGSSVGTSGTSSSRLTQKDTRGLGVFGRLGLRERARGPSPATITDLALAAERAALAPVLALAAVDDDGDVRVVLVVVDHLVEELVLELPRNHAVDHLAPDCRSAPRER